VGFGWPVDAGGKSSTDGPALRLRDLLWDSGQAAHLVAILALYALFFSQPLDAAGIVSHASRLSDRHFWLSALGVSFANSLLENIFWRAFYSNEHRGPPGLGKAAILNGLLFGVHHHWLLLSCFFLPHRGSPDLRDRWRRLDLVLYAPERPFDLACHLSSHHGDLAVMTAGYFILFS
jgi:membrane protease YdiL (CAAX protease family)